MSRSNKHKLFLSIGICGVAFMGYAAPHLELPAVIAGCIVNICWIWDKL